MIQPKRGCYGAKCNGEVCRILHDPELSPPHHWLASLSLYSGRLGCGDSFRYRGGTGIFCRENRRPFPAPVFPRYPWAICPISIFTSWMSPGMAWWPNGGARAAMVTHLTPVYRPARVDAEMERLAQAAGGIPPGPGQPRNPPHVPGERQDDGADEIPRPARLS